MEDCIKKVSMIDYMAMRKYMSEEVEAHIWHKLCEQNISNDSAVRYWLDDEREDTWEEHKHLLQEWGTLTDTSEAEYKAVGVFEELIKPYAQGYGEVLLWVSW